MIAILKDKKAKKSLVYDLDTILPFPEDFETYSKKALVQIPNIKDDFIRFISAINNNCKLKKKEAKHNQIFLKIVQSNSCSLLFGKFRIG